MHPLIISAIYTTLALQIASPVNNGNPAVAGSSLLIKAIFEQADPTEVPISLIKVNGNPDNVTRIQSLGTIKKANPEITVVLQMNLTNGNDYAIQIGDEKPNQNFSSTFSINGGESKTSEKDSMNSAADEQASTPKSTNKQNSSPSEIPNAIFPILLILSQ